MELVKEVRAHRIAMGSEIAPAASLDVNILELVQKICNEDFYKEDYREITLKLISDSLEYEMFPNLKGVISTNRGESCGGGKKNGGVFKIEKYLSTWNCVK